MSHNRIIQVGNKPSFYKTAFCIFNYLQFPASYRRIQLSFGGNDLYLRKELKKKELA